MTTNRTPFSPLAAALLAAVFATGTAHADRDQLAANFIAADTNADRALNLQEFTTFINLNADQGLGRAGMVKRSNRYAMAFGRLDQNGDGKITTAEFQAAAQAQ